MSETIIFFGNERMATGVSTSAPTLQALISAGYRIAAVVANYEASQSRSLRSLEIGAIAQEHNIPLLLPKQLNDIKAEIQAYDAIAGVLVAYGKMIPQSIIELFPRGIINIHPSLLPRHRGPTPLESVILGGDEKTGVSIMQLAKEMDSGPVYAQSELSLTGSETKMSLADSLLDIGQAMIINLLPDILEGTVIALPQDSTQATYDPLISKEDGKLDWNKPAIQLEREIRAFIGWPQSRTMLGDKEVIITKAAVVDESGKPGQIRSSTRDLVAYTSKQALSIHELKPVGKPVMSVQAFLAGYQHYL
jgi:methionyl-tRNA formyltransferase